MPGFSAITREKPLSVKVVPSTAFDIRWEDRPKSDVCIGLRLIADDDLQNGRAEASKFASRLHPKALEFPQSYDAQLWADAYIDACKRWIIASGTCDPNDVTRSWSGWAAAPEDMVRTALTMSGRDLLFDAWERMRIETDITQREASDEEISSLAALCTEHLPSIEPARAARIRRLIAFVIDELS